MLRNLMKTLAAFALPLIILQGCSRGESAESKRQGADAYPVAVDAARSDSSAKENYYIGTVEAAKTIPVSFSIPGTVENVYAAEGQFVHKGQVLASLNSATYRSSVKMSEAVEKQAKDAYNRLSKVYNEGSLSEIKFVEIESKLQQAVAATDIARKSLSDCIIKAPISAMVGRKSIEPGANALPMTAAFTLYSIDNVLITVPVPEDEISKIKKGQTARIIVPALDNREFSGAVHEIGVAANMISHTYDVKIMIANPQNMLKPGMVCNVYMNTNSEMRAVSVANNAIVSENGKKFVYIVEGGANKVKKQEVSTGKYSGSNIIILAGINPGDKIVVAGQHKLYDGASIIINR